MGICLVHGQCSNSHVIKQWSVPVSCSRREQAVPSEAAGKQTAMASASSWTTKLLGHLRSQARTAPLKINLNPYMNTNLHRNWWNSYASRCPSIRTKGSQHISRLQKRALVPVMLLWRQMHTILEESPLQEQLSKIDGQWAVLDHEGLLLLASSSAGTKDNRWASERGVWGDDS